jgi:RNA polymerase sigma factor (sigma-70 family)
MKYPLAADVILPVSLSFERAPVTGCHGTGSPGDGEDRQIWQAFKSGDRRMFALMYTANARDLYNYGTKITTDEELVRDCIQDLYIELWRNRQTLGETDSVRYYLRKGLRRKIIRHITRSKKNTFTGNLPDESDMDVVVSYEHALILSQHQQEQKERLRAAIGQLTRRQKQALALKFFDELTYKEVSSIMSLSHQSVYNLIHQALAILKEKLGGLVTLLAIFQFCD